MFSWTGFYIGGNIGAGWGRGNVVDSLFGVNFTNGNSASFLGGGQVGGNYQIGAFVIGAVAGVLVIVSVFFFDKVKVDDPVGAISVHGVNGAWGLIAVGLFSDGSYGQGWNGVGATDYLGVAGKGVADAGAMIEAITRLARVNAQGKDRG